MQLLTSKVASALPPEGSKAKYTEVVPAELKQVRLGRDRVQFSVPATSLPASHVKQFLFQQHSR